METHTPTHTKLLSSNLIYLRAAEPEDLEILYRWENDTEIWKVSDTLIPLSRFTMKLYLERAGQDLYETKQLRMMVVKRDNEEVVGSVDLFDYEPLHQRVGVGLYIEKKYQNQKIGTTSIQLTLQYAFEHLQLHQVYCHVGAHNKRSIKLFRKLGFEQTGEKKDWLSTPTGFENVLLLQCINPTSKK